MGGCGIDKPPKRELYGDDVLSLLCYAQEVLRIDTVVLFPLASEVNNINSRKIGKSSKFHLIEFVIICMHFKL